MGMDWLKGLVGSSDQMVPAGQAIPGGPQYGGPQYGAYAPPGPPQYGAPAAPPAPGAPQYGAPPGAAPMGPPMGGMPPGPAAWGPPPAAYSPPTGAAPVGPGMPAPPPAGAPSWVGGPAPEPAPTPGDPQAMRIAELQNQCAQLRKDVDSIALFARTLLTLLEEKQIVTEAQFVEARRKLDLLDGKLDDRIG
ncbi:MAG: hypothetical protein QM820_27010 [Minicystis sp.]